MAVVHPLKSLCRTKCDSHTEEQLPKRTKTYTVKVRLLQFAVLFSVLPTVIKEMILDYLRVADLCTLFEFFTLDRNLLVREICRRALRTLRVDRVTNRLEFVREDNCACPNHLGTNMFEDEMRWGTDPKPRVAFIKEWGALRFRVKQWDRGVLYPCFAIAQFSSQEENLQRYWWEMNIRDDGSLPHFDEYSLPALPNNIPHLGEQLLAVMMRVSSYGFNPVEYWIARNKLKPTRLVCETEVEPKHTLSWTTYVEEEGGTRFGLSDIVVRDSFSGAHSLIVAARSGFVELRYRGKKLDVFLECVLQWPNLKE